MREIIGTCKVSGCDGDIVETNVFMQGSAGIGVLSIELERLKKATCETCGLTYDPATIRKLSQKM
jgi:hypothetical protein